MPSQSDEKAATPFEKFRELVQRVVSVPKKEIDRREAIAKENKRNVNKPGLKS